MAFNSRAFLKNIPIIIYAFVIISALSPVKISAQLKEIDTKNMR
jgi:hypothetical protein